jgi:hypothetical protein
MAEGTDRLDKTPEEVYHNNLLALTAPYVEDSSPDVIHEDERLVEEILVEDSSEEEAISEDEERRPLTSGFVAAELIPSSELPECHAEPLPDGAILNQQQLDIADYLYRVNQTVAEGLVNLQRQYPSFGNLSPTYSPRRAGVQRRPSVDPPGGSTHSSRGERPDPPEVDPRMQASTASPLWIFQEVRVSAEKENTKDSHDSERSPSPVLWQARYLEETRQLDEERKSEKRSHEGPCPFAALERQWTRDASATSVGRMASFNPLAMSPDDVGENTTTSRPNPPAERMTKRFKSSPL